MTDSTGFSGFEPTDFTGLFRLGPTVPRIFESDARLHPNWADFQNRWALVLMCRGQVDEAVGILAHCLDINPRYCWAGINHVQALGLSGRTGTARERLAAVTLPRPWMRSVLAAFLDWCDGDPETGLDRFRGLEPGVRNRPDVRRLELAMSGGADAPGELAELDPWAATLLPADSTGSRLMLHVFGLHELMNATGRMLARMNDMGTARYLAEVSEALWSDPATNLNQRAFLALHADEPDAAVTMYEQATRIAPERPEAFISLAYYWSAEGQLERAHWALHQALDRAPRFADLHYQMGQLEHARGDLKRALASYERALEINPRYCMARLEQAMTLLALRRWEPARDAFAEVLATDLRSADILIHAAEAHEHTNAQETALELLTEALALGQDPMVAYRMGSLLGRMGRTEEARSRLEQFLNSIPESERDEALARWRTDTGLDLNTGEWTHGTD